jgi:LL-diaminopimelate aminotransferase
VQLAGGNCREYELNEENNYEPDFDALSKIDLSKTKLMWVNYPQMPTGRLPGKNLFQKLVAFGKEKQILICHDNPYSFILNENPASLLAVEGAKDCAIELNSLSKSHNMAGWRVGMLCGAKERIDEVLRFKSNMDSGMFLPVQLAAAKALSLGKDWYDGVNKVYKSRRERVFELLDKLDCKYSNQQAGLFVWAKINHRFTDCYDCSDYILHNCNVFITPGGIFGSAGKKYIRVSLCSKEERLEEAKQRIINNY